jgi:carboxypeptidase C (cathepsin A)
MRLFPILTFALMALLASASGPAVAKDAAPAASAEGIFSLLPADSTTEHRLALPDGDVRYRATAGTLDLRGRDGKVTARIFYTAYVAEDASAKRPLTFAFNGGPGAASAYLHLGLAGPRIVNFGPSGDDGDNATLKDNPDSWLRFTDLVFIDPVGTGWSRAAGDGRDFYGVGQDAEALAKAIALYVERNGRTASPKYLLGESYGGFRAAKLAGALKSSQGILVSGVVMVSPLIEANLIFDASQTPVGAALLLPSVAAAEFERRGTFDPAAIRAAERFAMTDYLVALAGAPPRGPDAESLYGRIADLTGLDPARVAASRGFIGDLLAKSRPGMIASPYDAARTVPDPYPESATDHAEDPILDGYTRAYGSFFASYARSELGYPCEMTYTLLSMDVNRQWDWKEGRSGGRSDAGAADDLRDLLATLPHFRLLVMHGYSDVITPYGASRYVLDHIPAALAEGRTGLALYRGGHMFYTRPDSRAAATADAAAFYARGARTE